MTRKEQIERAAIAAYLTADCRAAEHFVAGAMWSDEHPAWISVEDELPKNKERVFITDGECTDLGFYDYTDDAWQPFEQWLGNITHWMPLPQPPSSSEIPNNHKKGGGQ